MHTFPNGKKYIGITRQKPKERWGANGSGYKKQPIYKAIQLYGWNNITHDVVYENVSKEFAQEKEKELIQKFDTIRNGYNVSPGGGCGGDNWTLFKYNGQLYTSDEISSLSDVEGITGHDITTRVRCHGWSLKRAMTTKKTEKNQMFLYKNKFYTAKQLAKMSKIRDLTYSDILCRINKHGWSVDRAISQPKDKKKQPKGIGATIYEYNGKLYNSYELALLGKQYNLTSSDITNRINHHGWSIEKAISTPKKKINQLFEYGGKKYTSKQLADMSKFPDVTYHDITDRINCCGWSVEKAINTPKKH